MNNRIRYVQLKPSPEQVLASLPWTGRKRPYILITFQDGSTKSITIKHVDLRTDTRKALAVAEKALRKIQGEVALESFNLKEYLPHLNKMTLGKFRRLYLDHREKEIERGNISQNTFDTDNQSTKLLITVFGEQRLLSEISRNAVQHFIDTLLGSTTKFGKPYKPTSINVHLRTLRSAFSHARKLGLISVNPFIGFPLLNVDTSPRYLEESEIQKIRQYLEKSEVSWHLDFFEFGLKTGLRRSEILDVNINRLRANDIDGETRHFLRVIGKGSRKFKEKSRWVPVNDVMEIIERRRAIMSDPQKLNELLFNSGNKNAESWRRRAFDGYLFFEISSRNSVNEFFRVAKMKCHLQENVSIHSLRHTFAVNFLENRRGDVYALSQILGHTDLKVTTETYLTATPKIITMYR